MRINYTFLIILFLSAAFSCKSTKTVTAENTVESSTVENDSGTSVQDDSDTTVNQQEEHSIFATIDRGACYGSCPTYKMTIHSDGFVEYQGIRAVDLIGNYTTTITKAQMEELTKMAEEIDYMTLEDVYDGPVSDLPGTRTSIVIDGVRKEVYRRYEYPKRILKFEALFDDIMKNSDWTKTEEDQD